MTANGAATRVVEMKIKPQAERAARSAANGLVGIPGSVEQVLQRFSIDQVSPLAPTSSLTSLHASDSPTAAALSRWVRVSVSLDTAPHDVVTALAELDEVEMVYVLPEILPADHSASHAAAGEVASAAAGTSRAETHSTTPDFEPQQGYLKPAADHGIDAYYAWTLPGGTGKNVRITDIEQGWPDDHEDLTGLKAGKLSTAPQAAGPRDHGVGVAGVLWGERNGFGITGIAYESRIQLSNVLQEDGKNDTARALMVAIENSRAGDVLLVEQQVTACGSYAPIEVVPSVHDVIKQAVSQGIHVVVAGGNGGADLDAECFSKGNFPNGAGDSGSILVGAGHSPQCSDTPNEAVKASNYGSPVKLQGWGECVVTAGTGDLHGQSMVNHYTKGFRNTSAAAPIVAGAVASISSIGHERGVVFSPKQMRDLLITTGTPQAGSKHIGPLPNLRAALDTLGYKPGPGSQPGWNTYSFIGPRQIPDVGSSSTSVDSTTQAATTARIGLSIDHDCSENLAIDIVTPDGTVNLLKRAKVVRQCTPWRGERVASYPLRSKSSGTWELRVTDNVKGAEGVLNYWFVALK